MKKSQNLELLSHLKTFESPPPYLLMPLSFVQKMFLAKIRLSAIAIRIETGRYERPKLMIQQRLDKLLKPDKLSTLGAPAKCEIV